jgi:hypothetical protein
MEILEVSYNEYAEVIRAPYHVFGSADFNYLNRNKCDEVFFILFRDGKYRLGIIGGIRDKAFVSPISAPFGGYSFISDDIRLQYIEEATKLLENWAVRKQFTSISMTLPPSIYGSSFIAKQFNCLWRQGFNVAESDLNYSFQLEDLNDTYLDRIWYNARKNLRISTNSGLEYIKCISQKEKELAYDIIRKNRESRGYPLRMTWEQVSDTIQIINADFFLINNIDHTPIASAIIFHVSESVVQVIYWGDLPGHTESKPMNFLSFKVFEYYKSEGKRVVDIGPSTEHSLPNYGLCEFKEGIGCRIDPKYMLIKKLD